ncbi:AAA family ATPase [Paenibacillus polymyxa]|uniref:AAA family ATPase n=1 Tax=Paenibacillus TaxID=44249 RepID=UPI000F4DFC1A|nr:MULTISPECIES: SMC family ATPase [Paenibacillus]KAF6659224.1 SMC family ATPase [Paenibacillus sp. EKM301P]RPE01719.1 SMC family ATPase [Paenibacillus polymyxa]UBS85761.1 SMC family ATPase [Paenibacillus polymyxa]WHX34283.1 SMC family ATPase [Paenibacillus polymyxa]
MKPILLKLAGLQSYRESQEIRFDDLTETGLFGIFGPTGSGKSTLLDAITLAMYGKVERAVNGTQGIMNHAEDTLSVAFTFELMSAQGPRRYRVERRFKRAGGVSVNNTLSRFIAYTEDGEEVLADKVQDVTRCVEEYIGLKMDDFTRAVVLPQGKFAEFLSLKGSERRQMLQRLFHLEKYGDQLAQKLSRRVKDNDIALKSLEAEQQGLGDASAEALELVKLRLQEAMDHAEASRRELERVSREAEVLNKTRELVMELSQRVNELEDMARQEPGIALLERKLRQASAAEALLPALTDWKEAVAEAEKRQKNAEQMAVQAASAAETALVSVQADEQARQALSAEEPKLLLRIDQLEQALQLERDTEVLWTERERLAAELAHSEQTLAEHAAGLAKEQELQTRGLKRQQELQQELKQNEVRADERRMLQEAVQRLQQLETAHEQWREAEQEYLAQEKRLALADERLKLMEQEIQETVARRSVLAAQAAEGIEALLALEAEITADVSALAAEEEQLRHELRAEELGRLAQHLAAELREGEPCAVCGSLHHPAPAAVAAHGADSAAPDELHRLRLGLQELRLTLRQQLHEQRSLLTQPAAADSGAAATGEPFTPAATVPRGVAVWAERCAALERAAAELAARAHTLPAEAQALREADAAGQQRRIRAAAEQEAAVAALAQARSKREACTTRSEGLRAEWAAQLPDVGPDQAAERYRAMQERDRRAEELRSRLETSVTFLEEKAARVQQIQQSIIEEDKIIIARRTGLQSKDDLLREKQEQLRKWVGEGQAASLLEEATSRLLGLKNGAEAAARRRTEAEERKHQAVHASLIARQASDSAEERRQTAASRWGIRLEASSFATEAEVLECCLGPEEATRYEREVNLHREREKELSSRLKHVEEQLNGATITEEQWETTTARLRDCRARDEEALQNRAKAERDLEDLQRRHVRWMELESNRLHLRSEAEKMSKLQSVFRGNAFVEYIAEEQLMQVSQSASRRLRFLTKQRYALEVDSSGGFVISDDANGGVKRPVSTLSGGETFLTSLSLALALSAQIQLRGQYPLQFFFLDEGFGTLDPELLDTVITSLEKLHHDQLSVGVISHVPELRARLPRKLVVLPAEQAGGGSRVVMETF